MKKFYVLGICMILSTGVFAETVQEQLSRIERKIDVLSQRLNCYSDEFDVAERKKNDLEIIEINTFYQRIKLSNGMSFYYLKGYNNGEGNIDHWLIGQEIRIKKSSKNGYVTLYNYDTDDSVEAQKSNY